MTIVSSYWRPDWNKPELQSSTIDQIFISRDATEEFIPASLRVGGMCTQGVSHFRGNFPQYYQKISDHCPVFASFRSFRDND